MQNLSFYFWRSWSTGYRILYLSLAALLVFALATMWYSYANNPAPAIDTQVIQDAELTEIPVHHFQKGIFDLSIAGNNYILYERLLGAPIQIPLWAGYAFIVALFAGLSILLAVFTTLNRFSYVVAMGLVILFIVSLRLESLLLFGLTDKTFTIATLVVYVLTSFYFYYFTQGSTFLQRLFVFVGISVAFLCVIAFFSRTPLPIYQVAANGVAAGMAVVVIFILLVAHEIVAAFVTIVTQGSKPSKSLNHFLIISLIYLVNLALAYAIRFRYVSWDMLTIDLFLLLTISALAGVWGIRKRQKQFDGILDVEPYGVLAYLALGSVSFAALAWFFAAANDAAIESLTDLIIFSHISYGLVFVLYVISNFGGMLSNNLAVHKVLYNPNNMPYFTFRLGGLIATAAFIIFNNWQVPFQNLIAGYYNAVGDHALATEDPELARAYYERGANLGFTNHHANYALANLEGARMNTAKERTYYERASQSRPTVMSFLNLTQTYQTEGFNLQALFRLRDALAVMPENGAIENSMALLFLKSGLRDSAQIYFQKATTHGERTLAEINLMAFRAQAKTPFDTLLNTHEDLLNNNSYRANVVAHQNFQRISTQLTLELPKDTVLNRSAAAWICNFLVNNPAQNDTTVLKKIVQLAKRPSNENLREALLYAVALSYYAHDEITTAYRFLEEVTINSANPGKYNNILALWTLEKNEPERALGYIEYALTQSYAPANLTHAVLQTEAGRSKEAIRAWDSLKVAKDTITAQLADRMLTLLSLPKQQAFLLSDEDKFAFAHYRADRNDTSFLYELASSISDADFKARTLLEQSEWQLANDDADGAIESFKKIRGLQLSNKTLYNQIRQFETLLLAEKSEWAPLEEILASQPNLPNKNKAYIQALLANSKGDTARATERFRWLSKADPFFQEGVVAAANYFHSHSKDPFMSYNILVESIQNHPKGARIRQAYCLEAARRGFEDIANSSLDELRKVWPAAKVKAVEDEVASILKAQQAAEE